jgi:hypothetical protein
MAVYGMTAYRSPFQKLCDAYDACVRAWGSDPAYKDYAFQIDQAMRGIGLLEASPGTRAAMQSRPPTPTGQVAPPPSQPSQAQSAGY